MTAQILTFPARDTTPATPRRPSHTDHECAVNAGINPEAQTLLDDQFERAIDRLKLGDSILAIVADAFRAGTVHGYEQALQDARGGFA